MSEYIDIYIDTTTKVPEDATEFDYELFEHFMSGGPWVAHSEYMKLKAENAKLREELAKARDPQRIGGQAEPSSFVYSIEQLREFCWQHATNDEDAIPYINNVAAAHERENAKLREELTKMDQWHSRELKAAMAENTKLRELVDDLYFDLLGEMPESMLEDIRLQMRELGIEVD